MQTKTTQISSFALHFGLRANIRLRNFSISPKHSDLGNDKVLNTY